MMEKANHYMIYMYTFIKILVENTMEKFSQAKNELILGIKNKDLQFNAWFVVLLAAILVFATAIFAGLTIWNQHGKFTGNWNWHIKGVSLDVECKR